jgi:hypothetical protein
MTGVSTKVSISAGSLPIGLLLVIAALSIPAGCKKSGNGGINPAFSMSATLTGAGASGFQIVSEFGSESQSLGTFAIEGIRPETSDSMILEVSFPDSIVLNTPTPIASSNGEGIYFGDTEGLSAAFIAYQNVGHGTITITSWDHLKLNIAGTFSGVLYDQSLTDSVVVTNGVFSGTYLIGP